MGTVRMSDDRVPSTNIESPYGGGVSSLPGATGSLLPVKFPATPVLIADEPRLGSWQVAVVGDASGWKCPRVEQNRQQPSDVSALHGGPGSPYIKEMVTSTEDTGVVIPVVLAGGSPLTSAVNPTGPDGPVVAGDPVGPCETPSPSSCGTLEPLEHSVLIHADPAGQHAAVGTLSPSDCYPAGPAGPCVAGGPVGPDVLFKILELLEHSVLDHADPAGQHAAVGTLSPSDCYPVGPAGPCVAGGPVGPDDYLQVLEPLEHSVLDHADPAGHHADIQDTVKSLEH